MDELEITVGMSADAVLDALGRPRFIKVVGNEGVDKVRLPDGTETTTTRLLVEWTYGSIVVSLAHREGLYRVVGVRPRLPEVRRNDLCPCGSGKKYKHCCMKKGGENEM